MIKGLLHMSIIMIGICAGTFPVPAQLSAVKPDLRVEELSFVSVTRNAGKKMIRIQVLLRVKNIGMGPSGSFQIDGLIQQGPDKTESGCQETIKSQGLAPGATFVKVMIFNEPESVFRNQTFLFAVKADASGKVTETDETNNRSQVLSLKLPDN